MKNINDRLENEELSAVQFVQDYVQLHFQDKGFTFYIWPTIQFDGCLYEFGNIDYRNKICEIIGEKIEKISIVETEQLIIHFNNAKIIENINPKNPKIISDICIFQDGEDFWIW